MLMQKSGVKVAKCPLFVIFHGRVDIWQLVSRIDFKICKTTLNAALLLNQLPAAAAAYPP